MSAPFLKWPGGKRGLLPEIRSRMPESYRTYVEPCVGGGAVFFDLEPKDAVLADVNPRLILTYRAVRDYPNQVIDRVQECCARHSRDFYYEVRAEANESWGNWIRQAGNLIYMNRAGFNGLYRENQKGQINVPFGNKDFLSIDPEVILQASRALSAAGACIEQAAVWDLGDWISAEDWVYIDPPYFPAKQGDFTSYSGTFGPKEQERLRDFAQSLDSRGVQVMLSNTDCPEVRALYASRTWIIESVLAPRRISRNGDRTPQAEVLIRNYPLRGI